MRFLLSVLDTYPQWDIDVLEQCYDSVDMLSLHHYHPALPEI
jgi:alpha-N-arabinofuranosidase